jgi:hypothetical protein
VDGLGTLGKGQEGLDSMALVDADDPGSAGHRDDARFGVQNRSVVPLQEGVDLEPRTVVDLRLPNGPLSLLGEKGQGKFGPTGRDQAPDFSLAGPAEDLKG